MPGDLSPGVARRTRPIWVETLLSIGKCELATESLERPALVRTPEGRWRLYLSCATFGTKHWRVEMTEAAHPGEFDVRRREVILPGDAKTGVKDPVIRYRKGQWHLWASCHPLVDPLQADQMTTEYATSDTARWASVCSGWDVTFCRGISVSRPVSTPRNAQIRSRVGAGSSTSRR